ncbi:hypothetical protein RvY_07990, partial [Ramazzottius varieornatus]
MSSFRVRTVDLEDQSRTANVYVGVELRPINNSQLLYRKVLNDERQRFAFAGLQLLSFWSLDSPSVFRSGPCLGPSSVSAAGLHLSEMATDIDRSAELRDEEMVVLESLLDIQEFQKTDHNSGIIEIYIVLEEGVEIVIIESLTELDALQESMRRDSSQKNGEEPLDKSLPANHAAVHHLPPIRLKFSLPDEYPLKQPANVCVSACWLPRRIAQSVEVQAKKIWEDNGHQAVLYELFQFATDRATSGDYFPFASPCLPIFPHDVVSAANCSSLVDSHNLLVVSHPVKLFRSMVHFDDNRVVV